MEEIIIIICILVWKEYAMIVIATGVLSSTSLPVIPCLMCACEEGLGGNSSYCKTCSGAEEAARKKNSTWIEQQ
jgi:hypothetical protein